MTTSLALIYKKVPELTAKKNPSIKSLVPGKYYSKYNSNRSH